MNLYLLVLTLAHVIQLPHILNSGHNLYNQTLPDRSRPLRLSFCKGNYYSYASKKGVEAVKHLIYPTPAFRSGQKQFSGLGTHLTLDLDQKIKFGPDVEWLETKLTRSILEMSQASSSTRHMLGEEIQDFWESHLATNEDSLETIFESVRSYLPHVQREHLAPDC